MRVTLLDIFSSKMAGISLNIQHNQEPDPKEKLMQKVQKRRVENT